MAIDQRAPDSTALRPHAILSGVIVAVHPFIGKVDVRIDAPDNRLFKMCEFSSPFTANGLGGIDFMPMIGAACIVMEGFANKGAGIHSDPIVIGFRPRTSGSFISRVDLKPGDIRLQGPEGNDILLRNNGDIYLVSDHQNLLGFISSESLLAVRSLNYEHDLAGGDLMWSLANDEEGSPIAFLCNIKRYATDVNPYLSIKAGSLASGGLSLILHSAEEVHDETPSDIFLNLVQSSAGFTFNVSDTGDLECSSRESISMEALQEFTVKAHVLSKIESPEIELTTGSSSIKTDEVGPMLIKAPRGLIIEAPSLKIISSDGSILESDPDGKHPVTVELLEWLFRHTHCVPLAPGNTLPPYGTPVLYSSVITAEAANNNVLVPFVAAGQAGSPQITTTNSVISNKTKVK